jgi:hypothetical protein
VSAEERAIESGDRFEDRDWRNEGRVVQVRSFSAARGKFEVQVEAAPKTPDSVGRTTFVSERTLRTKYRRVSR